MVQKWWCWYSISGSWTLQYSIQNKNDVFFVFFLLMQSAVIAGFLRCDINKVLSQCLKSSAKQLDIFMRSQPDSAEFHSTCATHQAERGGWKDCVLKGLGYAHFYNSIIKIDPWQSEVITAFTTCCKQRGTGPFEQVTTVIPFFPLPLIMLPFKKLTLQRMNQPETGIIWVWSTVTVQF